MGKAMLATIRVHEKGNSRQLCQLELTKFTESQVRTRMVERGLSDEAFFVCGISDWGVDRIMSLQEAYLLRRCVEELYDGDSFVVTHLLKKQVPVTQIITSYYRFFGTDEVALMKHLVRGCDTDSLVDYFFKTNNWVNALNQYVLRGKVLTTPKGFYLEGLP